VFGRVGVVEVVGEDHVLKRNHRQSDHEKETQGGALGTARNAGAAELTAHGSGNKSKGRECQGGDEADTSDLIHKYSLRGCS